jgi:hypothetical protein
MPPLRTLTSIALSRRLWVGRLALLLALFGGLAPTVSHAISWARGDGPALIEVCTSIGPRWMALGQVSDLQATNSGTPDTSAVFDHCPFCLLAADRLAPPPAALVHVFLANGTYQQVAPAQIFFVATHIAPSPPPRGPPLSF